MAEKTGESLGIEKQVKGGYDEVVERTMEALKTEGFGVLTRIDVKPVLKEKLGVDFRNYVILGACNPKLANKALNATLDVGLLLPCNVVVYEKEPGLVVVSAINPRAMMSMLPDAGLAEVAEQAASRLSAALEKI
ncbi:MAG: DUF302 domain-containing protein [Candidatus Nitrospinota bacterium M3_3B_026]